MLKAKYMHNVSKFPRIISVPAAHQLVAERSQATSLRPLQIIDKLIDFNRKIV